MAEADRKTAVADNQIAIEVFYKGIIASLPKDELGFAISRTNFNGRAVRSGTAAAGLNAEYVSEIYYAAHPFSRLELRPTTRAEGLRPRRSWCSVSSQR